jgi:hypothetical protein
LADYAASFKEAKDIHDEGGFTNIEADGSSQGLMKVFYCLLAADSGREEEREDAKLEALRLTTERIGIYCHLLIQKMSVSVIA